MPLLVAKTRTRDQIVNKLIHGLSCVVQLNLLGTDFRALLPQRNAAKMRGGPDGFGYALALVFALYIALVVTRIARTRR